MTLSQLALALARVPSGLFVLTVTTDEGDNGMLASWVQQAGFEPPMISVAVAHGRPFDEALSQGRPFAINILGDEQQDLVRHFSRTSDIQAAMLDDLALSASPAGVTVLADALAYLECLPRRHVDSGDHRVFLAEVTAGHLHASDRRPMVHLRKSGLHY